MTEMIGEMASCIIVGAGIGTVIALIARAVIALVNKIKTKSGNKCNKEI